MIYSILYLYFFTCVSEEALNSIPAMSLEEYFLGIYRPFLLVQYAFLRRSTCMIETIRSVEEEIKMHWPLET